jgi:hypothetical protein
VVLLLGLEVTVRHSFAMTHFQACQQLPEVSAREYLVKRPGEMVTSSSFQMQRTRKDVTKSKEKGEGMVRMSEVTISMKLLFINLATCVSNSQPPS